MNTYPLVRNAGFLQSLLVLALAISCSPIYVLEQGFKQLEITFKKQRIDKVLQEKKTSDEIRQKLLFIQEVKNFGTKKLGLRNTRSYEYYYDCGEKPIAYLIVVCPSDSLTPKTWWFPIVGRFPYLGFFNYYKAVNKKQKLQNKGYDVILRSVSAYSTVGWFSDPITSYLLLYPMQTISEIVLHEMVHETIYTRSKAEFNESSASFISEQANLMFIREKYSNESREYKEAVESYEIDKIWEKQLSDIRVSLEKIYSSRLTKMEKLEQKRTLLDGKFQELAMDDKFKHSLNKLGRDSWNNAYFAGFATYHYDTNVFHKMLEKCNNDLAKMIELLKRICSKGDPFALMNKYINGEDISLPMIKSKIRRR